MKRSVAVFALLVAPLLAQPPNLTINTGTPEGQQLQAIGQEADEAKKIRVGRGFSREVSEA